MLLLVTGWVQPPKKRMRRKRENYETIMRKQAGTSIAVFSEKKGVFKSTRTEKPAAETITRLMLRQL